MLRRLQCALHGSTHPGRARRKHKPFKNEQNAQTDEEVGEPYGPHRTEISPLMFFASSAKSARLASRFVLNLWLGRRRLSGSRRRGGGRRRAGWRGRGRF